MAHEPKQGRVVPTAATTTELGPSVGLWVPSGYEGNMRPNMAAVTPIGQQNQPGQLKVLVLCGKQC
jgi:hypothetical protein